MSSRRRRCSLLVDNSHLELESLVPSAELAQIRSGQARHVHGEQLSERAFEGRVMELGAAVDAEYARRKDPDPGGERGRTAEGWHVRAKARY